MFRIICLFLMLGFPKLGLCAFDTTVALSGKWIPNVPTSHLCINIHGVDIDSSLIIKYYIREIGDSIPIISFSLPQINDPKNDYWTKDEYLGESECKQSQIGAPCRIQYFTSTCLKYLDIKVSKDFVIKLKQQIVSYFKMMNKYPVEVIEHAADDAVSKISSGNMTYIWISTHPEVFLLYVWVPELKAFCAL